MIDKKWRKFERLVAALHYAEQKGAMVIWDDEINKRQFDVSIRFKAGLYDYLTVIECKNYSKPVPVKDVESFVTKSKDAKADKAVIVSSSGFQSGAIQVAEKHNIALISLKKLDSLTAKEIENDLSPVLLFFSFRLEIYGKKEFIAIPEEPEILRFFMRQSKIVGKGINTTPEEIVNNYYNEALKFATSIPQTLRIELPKETKFIQPNGLFRVTVSYFLFDYCLVSVNNLVSTEGLGIDPYLSGDIIELKDEKSGTTKLIDISSIALGFDTEMKEGKYYKNPNLGFSYYCKEIKDNKVRMLLVESYQGGNLVQADFTIFSDNTKQFVEIKDKGEILRLEDIHKKINQK